MANESKVVIKDHQVIPGKKVKLKDFSTKYERKFFSKQEAEEMLEVSRKHLVEVQDKLYAHNRYSVLIILQAMDAAGKDGAVKHIMSGFNPLGVKVYSFKAPNATDLDHNYLWRHQLALPARGEIAIHNRSHYENVLVTKIHPQWILNENIPGVESVKKVNDDFWDKRYKQIRRFEKNLTENGTVIMKFFLHVSKKEQKKRFLERIDDPSKNWKFSLSDLKERAYWDDYQKAYEKALYETTSEAAPWFVIPADDKWYARLAIAEIIAREFSKLDASYPTVSPAQKEELQKAKVQLMAEDGGDVKKKEVKTKAQPKK
ncbi:MAG: polyphosphate kinase 2 family protein [Cyclobacteriaceae bacterium]|nr:polyphosphate kinase 2 family protein [Cyclobacteriaceae bacterium]